MVPKNTIDLKAISVRSFLLSLLASSTLLLGGCETVNEAVSAAKEKVSAINFDMPDIQPTQDGMTTDQKDDAPAFEPYDYGKHRTEAQAANHQSGHNVASADEIMTETQDARSDRQARHTDQRTEGRLPCPPVDIVDELRAMHQFTDITRPQPQERISSIEIENVTASCDHDRENNDIIVNIAVTFTGTLGPRARIYETDQPAYAYPYFIAITDKSGRIISKEIFAASLSYGRYENTLTHTEMPRQYIPYNKQDIPGNYKIIAGFQLTPEELAFNRAGHDPAMATAPPTSIIRAPKPPQKPALGRPDASTVKADPARQESRPAENITDNPDISDSLDSPEPPKRNIKTDNPEPSSTATEETAPKNSPAKEMTEDPADEGPQDPIYPEEFDVPFIDDMENMEN